MYQPSAYTLVTGPVIYPLTLIDVKDQLRLNYDENSVEGVSLETAAVVYVDADSFTVAGDKRLVYIPGRYLEINQGGNAVVGYVLSSSYAAGGDLTTVAVNEAISVNSNISEVRYGDGRLVSYIQAATNEAELFLGRKLISQTWNIFYQVWPSGRGFDLPFGDVSSVVSLKHTDEDEAESTVATSVYGVDTDCVPGVLYLKPDESWPTDDLWPSNPIVVQAVFGYGETTASVPEDIRNAMLVMIDDMNEARGSKIIGTIITETKAAEMLLWTHRLHVV